MKTIEHLEKYVNDFLEESRIKTTDNIDAKLIQIIKKYANQKLDEAAEKATVTMQSGRNGCKMVVDKQSILSLKD